MFITVIKSNVPFTKLLMITTKNNRRQIENVYQVIRNVDAIVKTVVPHNRDALPRQRELQWRQRWGCSERFPFLPWVDVGGRREYLVVSDRQIALPVSFLRGAGLDPKHGRFVKIAC